MTKTENTAKENFSRRKFLSVAAAGTILLAESCREKSPVTTDPNVKDVGKSDLGALNFLYIIEQVQAEFFSHAALAGSVFTETELRLLSDIRNHDLLHVKFIHEQLLDSGLPAITSEQYNFSSVNFSDRASVIANAIRLKDMCSEAYCGILRLFTSNTNLVNMAKISSVESRHAQAIRMLLGANKYPDASEKIIDANGLENIWRPKATLAEINKFLKITYSAISMP